MAIQMWSLVQMLIEMTGKRKSIHFYTLEILDNKGLAYLMDLFILREPHLITRYMARDDLMEKQIALYNEMFNVLLLMIRNCRQLGFAASELTATAVFAKAHAWIEHLTD